MKPLILFITLALLVLCNACAADSAFESQKKKWGSQGWIYSETFGEATAHAEYISHMSSVTARTVKAFASDGNERKEKELKQAEELFLVVTMADNAGRTYAIIFKKKKGA